MAKWSPEDLEEQWGLYTSETLLNYDLRRLCKLQFILILLLFIDADKYSPL